MNKETVADILLQHLKEYVDSLNSYCKSTGVPNEYTIKLINGTKPLKQGDTVIKHYKTLELTLKVNKDIYVLYQAHIPLKNEIEATRSKYWLMQVVRDLYYQMFMNYCVVSHASILQSEGKLAPQQIGSMVKLDGSPLTSSKGEESNMKLVKGNKDK